MGLILSRKEYIGKKYRILTKDELTLSIYNKCKNIIYNIAEPGLDSRSLTQDQLNKKLDELDFKSRKVMVRYDTEAGKELYEIDYDFYIRHLYRFSELKENRLSVSMEQVMYDKLLGKLGGVASTCVQNIGLIKKDKDVIFKYKNLEENIESKYFKQVVTSDFISSFITCKYAIITVGIEGEEGKHRTIMFMENIDNNLTFFFYDSHGSGYMSYSYRAGFISYFQKIFKYMNDNKPENINSITFQAHETRCFYGMQSYTESYDIGMCQLYSSLWIYTVIKVIVDAHDNGVLLPPTSKWLYLVDEYYTTKLSTKQAYNALLLFGTFLFNIYSESYPKYVEELANFNSSLKKYYKIKKYKVEEESSSMTEEDRKEQARYYKETYDKGQEEYKKHVKEKIRRKLLPY